MSGTVESDTVTGVFRVSSLMEHKWS